MWLPAGYDAQHAYRLVFTFHGCGGPSQFIPMQEQTGADAIVVRGTARTAIRAAGLTAAKVTT